jgi:hypothetical protein
MLYMYICSREIPEIGNSIILGSPTSLDIIRKFELFAGDQPLPLGLCLDDVSSLFAEHRRALSFEVSGIDIAILVIDWHAILGLSICRLEWLQPSSKSTALRLDVLGGLGVCTQRVFWLNPWLGHCSLDPLGSGKMAWVPPILILSKLVAHMTFLSCLKMPGQP